MPNKDYIYTLITTIILLLCCSTGYSKTKIIRYPLFRTSTTPEFRIDSIEMSKRGTILYCHHNNKLHEFGSLTIRDSISLIDDRHRKYKLIKAEGISIYPDNTDTRELVRLNFVLYFPKIEKSDSVSLLETNDIHGFNVKGIDLTISGLFHEDLDYNEFNRLANYADFFRTAKNYGKYIAKLKPLLETYKIFFGEEAYCTYLESVLQSYYNLGEQDSIKALLPQYELLCKRLNHAPYPYYFNDDDMDVMILYNNACQARENGENEKSITLLKSVIEQRIKKYGITDKEVNRYKGYLGYWLLQDGDSIMSLKYSKEYADWYEKYYNSRDSTNRIYIATLQIICAISDDIGKIDDAIKYGTKLSEAEIKFGYGTLPSHIRTLYILGSDLSKAGRISEAAQTFKKAEKLYSADSLKCDSTYCNIAKALSFAYVQLNKPQKSIEVLLGASENLLKSEGSLSLNYLEILSCLAEKYRLTQQLGKSSEICWMINTILNNNYNTLSLKQCDVLKRLADTYASIGEDSKAQNIYNIEDSIYHRYNKEFSSDYGYFLLNQIQSLRHDTIRVKSISERIFRDFQDKDYNSRYIRVATLSNLAGLLSNSEPLKSIKYYEEILDLTESDSKFNHERNMTLDQIRLLHAANPTKDIISNVYNKYCIEEGEGNSSKSSYESIINLTKFLKGLTGSESDDSLKNYGQANKHLVDFISIKKDFEEAKTRILNDIVFMPEEERASYLKSTYISALDPNALGLLSFFLSDDAFNGIAYDYLLLTKSILLNSHNSIKQAIYEYGNMNLRKDLEYLSTYRKSMTRDQVEALERKLLSGIRSMNINLKKLDVTWKDIKSNLEDNEVAIEFFRSPYNDGEYKYSAFILRKEWEFPKYFDFSAIEIVIEKYGFERLSNMWTHLLDHNLIKPGDNIFFSGTGILNVVCPEHIALNDSLYFSDVFNVYRLTSTRELAFRQNSTCVDNEKLILYGGLDYNGLHTQDSSLKNPTYVANRMRGMEGNEIYRSGFEYLPNTLNEVNNIKAIAKTCKRKSKEYVGKRGTEESFKSLSGANIPIIHLATHGKYYGSDNNSNASTDNYLYNQVCKFGNDCLNRSFLVLAGGNALPKHQTIPQDQEDGLLTAKEVSELDFHKTGLVVLSTCESGLGDMSNEGVMGLQYGFKKAGVQSILMSLDKVDDKATQLLMVEFYKNLLSGKSKFNSLREAQRYLRTTENGKYKDPKYWASFVLLDALD